MMFKLAVSAVLALTVAPFPQSASSRVDCLPARDLAQKSFARIDGLGLRFTFVWVDDIQSKLVGGYDPFDLFVVAGKLYSPFEMSSGKLERSAFERLSGGKGIDRFGPFKVPASFAANQPPTFPFTSESKKYQLRATAVKPARFGGEDLVTIQVCRE
jgi:hypothetical protein